LVESDWGNSRLAIQLSTQAFWAAVALAAVAFGGSARAAETCRVLDIELVGSFEGGCKDGLAEGQGKASGIATYAGRFAAGKKSGQGVKVWPNGDRYEGNFVDDRKEGLGAYTWGPSGPNAAERYSGNYRADQRDGYGIYEWPSGDRYVGEWANDAIIGAPTAGMLARSANLNEAEAAMSKPGTKVCRAIRVGISESDFASGTVMGSRPGEIQIRVDRPGRFEIDWNGASLKQGNIVWDRMISWTPCR
jgi:hypothetical protein